jgi:hypothetical protein
MGQGLLLPGRMSTQLAGLQLIMILACGRCTQQFVSIFTETIDWADGEDPQYWTLLPITDAEATELVQRQGSVTETQLNALGPGRRCLRRDHPKGKGPRILWGAGISVGPHD